MVTWTALAVAVPPQGWKHTNALRHVGSRLGLDVDEREGTGVIKVSGSVNWVSDGSHRKTGGR